MTDDEEDAAFMATPAGTASTFFELAKAGHFDIAWKLTDAEWRLVRVQSWLWTNQSHPDFADANFAAEAAAAVVDAPDRWWWPSFVEDESRWWGESPYDPDTWGASNRPRPFDIDYEVVVFRYTAGEVLIVPEGGEAPEAPTIVVLMHLVDRRWLVAAVNHRYQPGWPPTYEDGTPAV